ncbi:hypothetical protein N431DRAFT_432689 [Stipitochalara longipes BDJ]|nr:hypothetical protein N431DRAFT_432689 [Stipitochalara longipes BDJ]
MAEPKTLEQAKAFIKELESKLTKEINLRRDAEKAYEDQTDVEDKGARVTQEVPWQWLRV